MTETFNNKNWNSITISSNSGYGSSIPLNKNQIPKFQTTNSSSSSKSSIEFEFPNHPSISIGNKQTYNQFDYKTHSSSVSAEKKPEPFTQQTQAPTEKLKMVWAKSTKSTLDDESDDDEEEESNMQGKPKFGTFGQANLNEMNGIGEQNDDFYAPSFARSSDMLKTFSDLGNQELDDEDEEEQSTQTPILNDSNKIQDFRNRIQQQRQQQKQQQQPQLQSQMTQQPIMQNQQEEEESENMDDIEGDPLPDVYTEAEFLKYGKTPKTLLQEYVMKHNPNRGIPVPNVDYQIYSNPSGFIGTLSLRPSFPLTFHSYGTFRKKKDVENALAWDACKHFKVKLIDPEKFKKFHQHSIQNAMDNKTVAPTLKIENENKGFKLLQKMGWKPGQGIGLKQQENGNDSNPNNSLNSENNVHNNSSTFSIDGADDGAAFSETLTVKFQMYVDERLMAYQSSNEQVLLFSQMMSKAQFDYVRQRCWRMKLKTTSFVNQKYQKILCVSKKKIDQKTLADFVPDAIKMKKLQHPNPTPLPTQNQVQSAAQGFPVFKAATDTSDQPSSNQQIPPQTYDANQYSAQHQQTYQTNQAIMYGSYEHQQQMHQQQHQHQQQATAGYDAYYGVPQVGQQVSYQQVQISSYPQQPQQIQYQQQTYSQHPSQQQHQQPQQQYIGQYQQSGPSQQSGYAPSYQPQQHYVPQYNPQQYQQHYSQQQPQQQQPQQQQQQSQQQSYSFQQFAQPYR